ncbi:MAG: OmpA family protein [Ignavibacteriales bacterium]|nr:OmpA family protein [Ignavibacteriales bacterium]
MHHELPVLIVKKKKNQHGGHHGGAWKVAYADFVTAMMALFIVLWIVGQSKQVKSYIANYFRDPGAFFENTRGGGTSESNQPPLAEPVREESLRRQKEKMKEMASSVLTELENQPQLKALAKQIKVEFDKEGMHIELLEASESFFFDIGTSTLKPPAVQILQTIAHQLGTLDNDAVIEGHTDSRQYSRPDGYTNFELSAERANSARRVLAAYGVRESQVVEVRGYADRKLRNTENPLDIINRRISILVKYKEEHAGG